MQKWMSCNIQMCRDIEGLKGLAPFKEVSLMTSPIRVETVSPHLSSQSGTLVKMRLTLFVILTTLAFIVSFSAAQDDEGELIGFNIVQPDHFILLHLLVNCCHVMKNYCLRNDAMFRLIWQPAIWMHDSHKQLGFDSNHLRGIRNAHPNRKKTVFIIDWYKNLDSSSFHEVYTLISSESFNKTKRSALPKLLIQVLMLSESTAIYGKRDENEM